MKARMLTLPELFLIAGTRVALGAGVGLLLADRLSDERRRAVGWTLLGIGALSTIPLAGSVLRRQSFDPATVSSFASPPLPEEQSFAVTSL